MANPGLREQLAEALAEMRKTTTFGLVFEEHLPELALLPRASIAVGGLVQRRDATEPGLLRVRSLANGRAAVEPADAGSQTSATKLVDVKDLVALNRFGDPVFPLLTPLGSIRRANRDRPAHVVIEGENYHALQLLRYALPGRVDCIYIDPPFNTGDPTWKYNNRFIDKNDDYRHSKWLAMMSRRLRLAKSLLKPDGVLVIAIDENEHAHLLMLLEQLFRKHEFTSVAIQHNPRGIQGDNFSVSNEFAVFVIPQGLKRIARRPLAEDEMDGSTLRNWGGESERYDAATCFYPIYVRAGEIVGFGDVLPDEVHPTGANEQLADGRIAVWPIDDKGVERKWRYSRDSVEEIRSNLSAKRRGRGKGPWDIELTKGDVAYKTIWSSPLYDASTYGTQVVNRLTATPFPFPKSLYAVYDVLHACTSDRPDATIVDFFAGSGTTMHAVWLLNHADGGSRRCILVTNNEVGSDAEASLRKQGRFPGDDAFEREGIFESVTRPRLEAALTGRGPDGAPLKAQWTYRRGAGRKWRAGFDESVEFFRLDYADPDGLELGQNDDDFLRLLWLASGSVGDPDWTRGTCDMKAPVGGRGAMLFNGRAFRALTDLVSQRPELTDVWFVTDSDTAYSEMTSRLSRTTRTKMQYADYIEAFRRRGERA